MILAVDPDLLKAVSNDKDAQNIVAWLTREIESLYFAIDKQTGILLKEYKEILNDYQDSELLVQFVGELLNRIGTQTKFILSDPTPNIEAIIQKHCSEPVEPTLVGMGCYAKGLDYRILLSSRGGRERGLRDNDIRRQVCKELRIKIVLSNTPISYPALAPEVKTHIDTQFEDKCLNVLREIFKFQHTYKRTPPVIEDSVGDIDIYGYNQEGNPRQVWIGECKLFHSDKNDFVEGGKVGQLENKLDAVQSYEMGLRGVEVVIKRFVVSNGTDMHSDAWELLKSIQATFFRASLTRNWQNDPHWEIEKLEEFEAYQNENGEWEGRLLHTFPLG